MILPAEGAFDERAALEQVYGDNWVSFNLYPDSIAVERIAWEFTGDWGEGFYIENKPAFTTVRFAAPFKYGSEDRYLLVAQTYIDLGSYDWYSRLEGMLFSKSGDVWQSDVTASVIASWRDWRYHLYSSELVQIGPDRYGYLLIFSSSWTGFGEKSMFLLSLENGFAFILNEVRIAHTSYMCNGESATACSEYTSYLEFIPGGNPNYFDLIITTSGTRLAEDFSTVIPVYSVQTFVFDGREYVLSETSE